MVTSLLQAVSGRVGDEYGQFSGTGFGYAAAISAAQFVRTRQAERRAARRQRIGRQFATLQQSIEQLALRGQAAFWRGLQADVLARLRESARIPSDVVEIFQPARWASRFNDALRPQWVRGVTAGVQFESDWIGAREARQSALAHFVQDIEPERELPSFVVDLSPAMQHRLRDFLRNREVGVWDKVGASVHDRLRRALQRGLKEGDDFDAMAERIQHVLKGQSDYAARRIARTEATGSLNFGQQIERDEIGIEKKEWVSRIDIRTRGVDLKDAFNHIAADGQVVENAGVFVVSGQRMTHPCDGSHGATAGNICNCRCTAVSAFDDDLTVSSADQGEPPPDYPVAAARTEPSPDRSVGPRASQEEFIQSVLLQAMDDEQRSLTTASQINAVRAALTSHHRGLERIRMEVSAWDDSAAALEQADAAVSKAVDALAAVQNELEALLRRPRTISLLDRLDAAAERFRNAVKHWQDTKSQRDAVRATVGARLRRAFGVTDPARLEADFDTGDAAVRNTAEKALAWLNGLVGRKGGPTITIPVSRTLEARAYANRQRIFLNARDGVETAVHEISHLLEHGDAGAIENLARGFLHHRGGVEAAIGFRHSPELRRRGYRTQNFDWNEIGVEDEFRKAFGDASYYVGKYYAGATEVISMGVEALYKNPVRFARQDPEFFRFIVGVLNGAFLP